MFDHLLRALDDCLLELDRDVAAGKKLEEEDLHYGDLIAHFAKCLDTHAAMQESRGGYSNEYRDGSSYDNSSMRRRGGDGFARRSNYNSGRGYSRADRMDEVVQAMSGAMSDMPEDLRREAQRFMTKMQQQM